jgi:aerobic-type carbon monoxide dehydrogenase small subunit (CoxS/CutS family)
VAGAVQEVHELSGLNHRESVAGGGNLANANRFDAHLSRIPMGIANGSWGDEVEAALVCFDGMTTLHVNGERRDCDDARRNLLSYLRFDLGLTGTKYGCGEGLCGACTVLVDGQPLKSCLATVGSVAGGAVTTIEGLSDGVTLHALQRAFIDESAMQCGYCIPGFIMASAALLARAPHPTGGEAREALAENMCRCGTYPRIERAVLRAAEAGS